MTRYSPMPFSHRSQIPWNQVPRPLPVDSRKTSVSVRVRDRLPDARHLHLGVRPVGRLRAVEEVVRGAVAHRLVLLAAGGATRVFESSRSKRISFAFERSACGWITASLS
jgi:hypothetical protein